ncbi:hypothetical protein BDV23DRAFT_178974 [Aspergillus alliaceus]|uniref:Uncharacterized protein n=1 Tax=Petromyces alliaceus TaxID=209559 RepID=A0A5N7CL72_PETAA|nr:hypothetical protein BDV23DRAFT_178974 [Aspergillus alliaceus]
MIVIGGIISVDDAEWTPPRAENCNGATFANGVGIFDLRSLSWMTNYNTSDDAEYTIHPKISKVIGGNEPEHKFNDTEQADLFKRRSVRPTSSSEAFPTCSSISTSTSMTRASTGSSISGGAIARAIIGSVAGVCIPLGLVFLILRRCLKKRVTKLPIQANPLSRRPKVFQDYPSELPGERTPIACELSDVTFPHAELPTEANRRGSL